MKRKKYVAILILFLIALNIIIFKSFNLNPFLHKTAEYDYINNHAIFEEIVLKYKEKTTVITKEDYCGKSGSLLVLFEKMNYEFVRVTNEYVFFCKGYDGMTGVGVIYLINEDYSLLPKEKIVKKIGGQWAVFKEHYL